MKRITTVVAPLAFALALGTTAAARPLPAQDTAMRTTAVEMDDRDDDGFDMGWLGLLGLLGLLGMRGRKVEHHDHVTTGTAGTTGTRRP